MSTSPSPTGATPSESVLTLSRTTANGANADNADNTWEKKTLESERYVEINHEKKTALLGDESGKSIWASENTSSLNCDDVKYNYSPCSNTDTIGNGKADAPFNLRVGAAIGEGAENESTPVGAYVEDTLAALAGIHMHAGEEAKEETNIGTIEEINVGTNDDINDDTNTDTNADTNVDTNAEDAVGIRLGINERVCSGETPNIRGGSPRVRGFSTLGRAFGVDADNGNFPFIGGFDTDHCADYGESNWVNYNTNYGGNYGGNYGTNYAVNYVTSCGTSYGGNYGTNYAANYATSCGTNYSTNYGTNYGTNYATNYGTNYTTNYTTNCGTNYGRRFLPNHSQSLSLSPSAKNLPFHERGLLKTPPSGMYTFFRPNRKYELFKYNQQIKKGVKKSCPINEKYHKAKNEYTSNTGDVPPFKSANKYASCNCAILHKSMNTHKNENECTDIKQIHSDFIFLIIKYLYYERILPEANEVKRKISKYFPDCGVLNTNFVNICREDIHQRFLICKINPHEEEEEEEEKREKAYFRKTFNNENICIYLKDISKDFFINPNDDTESVLQYIPLLFIHIIDRFRLQSSDNNHKGGRYILAETLKHTGPYIFRTMKLGRIIHILQKCIDLNILSYYNNNIIPIFTSMAISKTYVSKMLVNETPDSKNHKENSITLIKDRIYRLLHSYSEDKTKGKGFSLSRLPLIYKNVYKESINIDQIGYSKLTEFINNELSDICFISTQHKFQCILMPLMENEQKHRDKNAKLKKEKQLKESLDYIKNYQWERCISYLHFSNYFRNKKREPQVKRAAPRDPIEQLINNSFLIKHKNYLDRTLKNGSDENVPLLLPLDVFNLPSSYDMYDTYHKSETYYSTNPSEDNSVIKCIDNMQSKCSILYDLEKCVSMDISIEESVNVNHMYHNYPSSYNVFHSLFNDTVEEIPIVDQHRMGI
ncbi:hypothetical protein PVX_118550 [Plasmodium vivax]|uniref:HTH OST-type domain-containing protein n=1 Tax=Plasmodium vivax (strain Salvador I) TaxID=126793 RepID=A5K422_PLAVS|nr:hypothetical protein PVX_118550 [Plasmodium vivax]EDL46276.1 hypothetical protein PVX_118550 [Plasmodium vivax]|eukprot:XP_001616003.1 hypothetical protein [Plasmodium vivax Sal-1]